MLHQAKFALCVIAFVWWCILALISLIAFIIAKKRYTNEKKSDQIPPEYILNNYPGVTILRPLKGYDYNLRSNLETAFCQNYPTLEILLCVESPTDPCIPIVRQLISDYPNVDARLLIGENNVGVNPKVNNLIKGFAAAKYDILWVCDSNVYVDPGCLCRSIKKLSEPGVVLVHHLPFATQSSTFGSDCELVYINTAHSKMYLFINSLGLASCVVGKSNIYRKSDLLKAGGLSQFGKYMAEDNMIAQALFDLGGTHEMTSDICYQPLGPMTIQEYFQRRSRWTRIRKHMVPVATFVEPFTESLVCGLAASYSFRYFWDVPVIVFMTIHMLVWYLLDLNLYKKLVAEESVRTIYPFTIAWIVRELTALPLYLYAISGHIVEWRQLKFKLLRGGTVHQVSERTQVKKENKQKQHVPQDHSVSIYCSSVESNYIKHVITECSLPVLNLEKYFYKTWIISVITSVFLLFQIFMEVMMLTQRTEGELYRRKSRNPMIEINNGNLNFESISNHPAPVAKTNFSSMKKAMALSPTFADGNNFPLGNTRDNSYTYSSTISFSEIWQICVIGLVMHIQNEKNEREFMKQQAVPVKFSNGTCKSPQYLKKEAYMKQFRNARHPAKLEKVCAPPAVS